jgi:uncharacterized protein (TIGR03000 family)
MFRQRLLALGAPILAAGAMLLTSNELFAQRRGGGGSRGGAPASASHGGNTWHGNTWNGGNNWHGDNWHGGYYHGGYYPGWGFGIGIGLPFAYGYSYPYYSGGYYYGPSYYPGYADYTVPDASSVTQNNALVEVRVPRSDATVWLEGAQTQQTGTEREFASPPLEQGKTYTYDVRARWIDKNGAVVDRTQHVPIHSGERVMVDFTRTTATE